MLYFLWQYALPMLMHALAEIPQVVVADLELPEDEGARLLRKADAWTRVKNGGFKTQNARAFQEA